MFPLSAVYIFTKRTFPLFKLLHFHNQDFSPFLFTAYIFAIKTFSLFSLDPYIFTLGIFPILSCIYVFRIRTFPLFKLYIFPDIRRSPLLSCIRPQETHTAASPSSPFLQNKKENNNQENTLCNKSKILLWIQMYPALLGLV